MSGSYPVTPRTRHRRIKERGSHERDIVHAILDEGLICHVGFAGPEGPVVIPMAYARDGERLLLHGSAGSRLMRELQKEVPICVTVTILDGLVLARSLFHHSMNYRSVVAFGRARLVVDEAEKRRALDVLSEHLAPGRTSQARGPSPEELDRTAVLEMPLEEVSAKARTGPPVDEPEDLGLAVWAGEVPLSLTPGVPVPAPEMDGSIPVPGCASAYRRRGGSGEK